MSEAEDNVRKEDLVVTRIIDAPVDIVWRAWTVPEHVMRWWGPKDYTSPSCIIDLREGGKYILCMRAPKEQGGQDSYSSGIYQRIVPKELLEVIQQNLTDKDGNPIDPVQAGMPADFPKESRMTVAFKPKGNMTELTVTQYDWNVSQMYVYALAGWQQSIDKLSNSLSTN
jgi:uncharacterized protein YndB with AHSA1/START domain